MGIQWELNGIEWDLMGIEWDLMEIRYWQLAITISIIKTFLDQ